MNEVILHFCVCFHGVKGKYLNGRFSGCPKHGTLKPGGVLNAFLSLGRTDSLKVNDSYLNIFIL
jgi:hypothetical protein